MVTSASPSGRAAAVLHDHLGPCGASRLVGGMVEALDEAGLLLTPEREAELRREGARRVGEQLECAYERHIHSFPIGTRRGADDGKGEGIREAIDITRRTSARPTSEETHD